MAERFRARPAQVRKGTVRVADPVAAQLRAGHPFVYREALGQRPLSAQPGEWIDVVDSSGAFVARGIYDPDAIVAVRVFTRDPGERLSPEAMLGRVRSARTLRERFLPAAGLTAYRVIHGEGDFVPGITVDRYDEFLVAQIYSAAADALLEPLADALESVWKPKGIYVQRRHRPQTGEGQRQPAEHYRGAVAPVEIEVEEGGLKFGVDVTAPLGTGLFLDLRVGRASLQARSRDKRVLNLFSYTGAISLYADRGGAKEIVSVDLAAKAHARARRNLQMSGLDEKRHEFIAGDAFKVLARMAERKRQFDLIILDPPSFAQTKERIFSVQKDYRELVEASLKVAARGAMLACVSNTHKVSSETLGRLIGEAGEHVRRHLRVVERLGLPPDFPVPPAYDDGHYLKFFLVSVD